MSNAVAKFTHRYDDSFTSRSLRREEERGASVGLVLSRIPLYCTSLIFSGVSTCAFLPSRLLKGQGMVLKPRKKKGCIQKTHLYPTEPLASWRCIVPLTIRLSDPCTFPNLVCHSAIVAFTALFLAR